MSPPETILAVVLGILSLAVLGAALIECGFAQAHLFKCVVMAVLVPWECFVLVWRKIRRAITRKYFRRRAAKNQVSNS